MAANADHRKYLLSLLSAYKEQSKILFPKFDKEQSETLDQFIDFVCSNPHCFSRENIKGHLTGSAFVVNKSFTKALMTYHAKLQLWLQLGGHADDEIHIEQVALKEAIEESGIENLTFLDISNAEKPLIELQPGKIILPFDLDIHLIPERKNEPAHFHYDVRFILVTENENFKISPESLDLKWITLDEIPLYTNEHSTLRQLHKVKELAKSAQSILYR